MIQFQDYLVHRRGRLSFLYSLSTVCLSIFRFPTAVAVIVWSLEPMTKHLKAMPHSKGGLMSGSDVVEFLSRVHLPNRK
jgi:hypothetical protein